MTTALEKDMNRGKKLLAGAVVAPVLLVTLPLVITFTLLLFAFSGGPAAAVVLFAGLIIAGLGLLAGIITTGVLLQKRSTWTREMREAIAANGIRAQDLNWFQREMKTTEKRALRSIEAHDELLGDAYRETLASRLTATRIIKTARGEMQHAKSRRASVKQLRGSRSQHFAEQVAVDITNIERIDSEAKDMLVEAEARLRMIEAASSRGGTLASSELALKKLSARAAELPLALEALRHTAEIRSEIDDAEIGLKEKFGEREP